MLDIKNKSPFLVALTPATDKHGRDFAVITIKGTYAYTSIGKVALHEEQVPILHADVFHGEPDKSSIKYASDVSLPKVSTDVALVGHAYAPFGKRTTQLDVQVRVGPVGKTIRVFGDRYWLRKLGFWRSTSPTPFARMPLVYERAYGGVDCMHTNPEKHASEQRNPIGTGFCVRGNAQHLEGQKLPNLEHKNELIRDCKDRPQPAGFGFIARNWLPRVKYAGTYDGKWKQEQCPFLPMDFDPRYFNAANPQLISNGFLKGGEQVEMVNVSKIPTIEFSLPKCHLQVEVQIKDKSTTYTPVLDGVLLEPDENRFVLAWRTAVECTRKFLHVKYVKVSVDKII